MENWQIFLIGFLSGAAIIVMAFCIIYVYAMKGTEKQIPADPYEPNLGDDELN